MSKEKIIGIDLGTSNSQAAVMLGGKPTIIPSAEGTTLAGKMFPSVIALTKDGQLLVGEPARRQAVSNPEGTVMAAKRMMGTDHIYRLHGKDYAPQQISAMILQKIKRDAEAFLGEPVTKAVITVPAYFNDNQRTATKDAGTIAGLDVVRLVNEPTAASMAYGLDKGEDHTILVFDLGGGTLDVTIMEFGGGIFSVLSTSGDTKLGGTDMDYAVIDWITAEFKRLEGVDLKADKMAVQRVREAAERAKIELSTVLETEINLPYITMDQSGPKHLTLKLSRARLEQLITPLIERCIHPFEQALADAKLGQEDIDRVILVGGPTRMPIVQKFIEDHIGKKVERGVDPMECVAIGAAIQGAILAGEITDLVLLDVTPLTLGIETLGQVTTPLIERNTTIPARKSQIFTTAADNQTAVTIHILQGERSMAADNISLGQFNLVGIPSAPRGIPQIEVTFDINASGILSVSAKDLATGSEQKMTVNAAKKLSEEEVKRMVSQATEFEADDKKRREEVQVRNDADAMVYAAEKTLADLGDKLPGDLKAKLESALKSSKEALNSGDIDTIRKTTGELQKVSLEAGTELYRNAQAAGSNAESAPDGQKETAESRENPEKDVVDADFKVKEE